ncbi:hypothetical protein [Metaclostridioides mangenotii]|uniref:hypothetical protein n=1 Tax=Metaclostridioides mangenotii TaxID=1540 RepID=UPI000ADEEA5B|nr:hypothetical protein [Clostridioides mangenotii]
MRINLSEILRVNIGVISRGKNVQKIVSITPTFDKRTIIDEINFEVVTHQCTHTMTYIPTNRNANSDEVKSKLKDLTRYKLMLEKDIKELDNNKKKETSQNVELEKDTAESKEYKNETVITKVDSGNSLEQIKKVFFKFKNSVSRHQKIYSLR